MPENPLAALGPIAWESLDCNDLNGFLAETFACAQIIADSVPTTASATAAAATTGRPRSQTDGAVSYNPSKIWGLGGGGGGSSSAATPASPVTATDYSLPRHRDKKVNELRQSWKEVRTGGANPRDVVVYKMNGGREGYAGSSWFARRSLHKKSAEKAPSAGSSVDIDFETFKNGLVHEFDMTPPSDSSGKKKPVRTMVTKKRVEHHIVKGTKEETSGGGGTTTGELNIYLLEADFPGPTASRDFVTMLLTAEASLPGIAGPCRQFMMVSKPCQHPETPTRSGFVRAQYESVEMIREVAIPKADGPSSVGRRTRSSIDLGRNSLDHDQDQDEGHEMAIEWIMITRNNPGGNVPRFLVDKSTPGSIVNDANKFLDWLVARAWAEQNSKRTAGENRTGREGKEGREGQQKDSAPSTAMSFSGLGAAIHEEEEEEEKEEARGGAATRSTRSTKTETAEQSDIPSIRGGAASSTRLYNMLVGALGGASTAVVSKLPNPFEGAVEVLCPEYGVGVAGVKETQAEGGDDASEDDLDDAVSEDTGGDSYSDIDDQSSDRTYDKTPDKTFDKMSDKTSDNTSNLVQQEPEHKCEPAPASQASQASQAFTGIHVSSGPQPTTVPITAAAATPSAPAATASNPSNPSNHATPAVDDTDSRSTSSKTRSVKEEKEQEKKERQAQKLLEKHSKAVARREAHFQKELTKLEQKRRQQADKEAARLQKKMASRSGADKAAAAAADKAAGKNKDKEHHKDKDIVGLLEYTERELERAALQIEALQKEVRQLELENRQLKRNSMEAAKI